MAKSREPDDELEAIERLVAKVREVPAEFAGVDALVRHSGVDAVRIGELLRKHYHASPEGVLVQARLGAAKRLLLGGTASESDIARASGFGSEAAFRERFFRANGLTPDAFRKLPGSDAFSIELPGGYPLGYLRRSLGRDDRSVTERLEGETYQAGVRLGAEPHALTLVLSPRRVTVSIEPGTSRMAEVHAMTVGMLGLDQDKAGFVALAGELGFERLVERCPELRIHQTASVFEGILWTIIGQQINLPFAFSLRRRLMELAGTALRDGLYAPPTPETVAELEPGDLLPLQFSRQKADYLISIARLIAEGGLDLEGLRRMSATRAERVLLSLRGLGVWSVNYLMMRSLGFADCVPLGDTGVTSNLQALLQLKQRPDADATRRLMAPFSPYRSLATAHLWQFRQGVPE